MNIGKKIPQPQTVDYVRVFFPFFFLPVSALNLDKALKLKLPGNESKIALLRIYILRERQAVAFSTISREDKNES